MKINFKILTICICFQMLCSAQSTKIDYVDDTKFPKGRLGTVTENIINTINANDGDKIKKFIENSFNDEFQNFAPMEAHQGYFLNFYSQTGGVSFHSIRTYNPNDEQGIVLILEDKNYNSWQKIRFSFVDETSLLMNSFQFSPAELPKDILKNTISSKELIKEAKKIVDKLSEKNLFSGAILIAKGNDILYQDSRGEASKRFHIKNNLETKFNLGSMNKMFTSVAILRLVEEKSMNLDDLINKYIDETWLPPDITSKVTISHLLSHTSGLGNYFNEKFWNSSRALYRNVDDYKPLVIGSSLAFEPGERFSYSNTGMLLLGAIIQEVTKQDYFEYIENNIYQPAQMMNTDSYEMDQPVENLAIGYSRADTKLGWENNLYKHVIKGGPAGGGFSTVGDLHKFAMALVNEKLVSKKSLNLLWTSHSNQAYGYGFSIKNGAGGKVVGHSGGFPGINSNLDIFLDSGYIVAVMSNYDQGASEIANKISNLIARLSK
ncbi:serine hydrolase domain-containing protein [Maribacter sp. IgM3_T14_3]|uniref:serine hydrolase domain-containing protein n=1 Tax=Maribacter sp. IgM3_T14_3 TaxID=3415140 RepID=UPI003C6F5D1B